MRQVEPWYLLAQLALRPPVALWFNWRFEGMEHIPADGPLLVACNHISYLDPLAHAYMMVRAGRRPRFLAKKELYSHWLVRHVLEGTGQIPVARGSGSAAPVEAAVHALRAGQAVMVYPEGTVTRNKDSTPMQGRTGIARLSLAAEVPVLPVAVWGSQFVWQREGLNDTRFGRPIWLKAGTPLDFSDFDDRREDPLALRSVTDTVMAELTRLVVELRGRYPRRWRANGSGAAAGP